MIGAARNSFLLILGILAGLFLLIAPYVIPLFSNTFWVNILTEILIWGLFAASVNLLFGYTGLLSFGQALFFGVGAYGVAFGLAYFGLSFWPAFLLGVAAATVAAAITGIFAVRLTWAYFAIITLVFSLIVYLFVVGRKDITNGDDGISFQVPPVFKIGSWEPSLLDMTFQYYFILVIVAALYLAIWVLMRSPLGYAFIAVRENDTRASLVGLNPYLIRFCSFVLAGTLAGTAGALFALFARYTTAQYMFWTVSGEGIVWMMVGGTGTLFGPALGAALLIYLREEISTVWEHFPIIVGFIAIVTVTFEPSGLMGMLNRWSERRRTLNRPTKTPHRPTKTPLADPKS